MHTRLEVVPTCRGDWKYRVRVCHVQPYVHHVHQSKTLVRFLFRASCDLRDLHWCGTVLFEGLRDWILVITLYFPRLCLRSESLSIKSWKSRYGNENRKERGISASLYYVSFLPLCRILPRAFFSGRNFSHSKRLLEFCACFHSQSSISYRLNSP